MKRNLHLASAIVLAALSSCTKTSELDQSIESAINSQTEMTFSSYASSATTTKGSAINSNDEFKGDEDNPGSFKVAALVGDAEFSALTYDNDNNLTGYTATPVDGTAISYFGFTDVNYSTEDGAWENSSKMYWPNASKLLFFAAYSPSTAGITDYSFSETTGDDEHDEHEEYCTFSFNYTVTDVIADQIDLMYAMKEVPYLAPTDQSKSTNDDSYITSAVMNTNTESSVNLHFKHALTQIAFTAIKDSDLDVYVKSITICNLYNSGTFVAHELTDDEDVLDEDDSIDNDTIGDTTEEGDLVNADNFGEWETIFSFDGWEGRYESIALTDSNDEETGYYAYYAIENGGGNKYISNYTAKLKSSTFVSAPSGDNAIQISSSGTTTLTSSSNVLMLLPQTVTAWTSTTSTELNYIGFGGDSTLSDTDLDVTVGTSKIESSSTDSKSLSYLAIECEIYHANGAVNEGDEIAPIHSGYVFVPFSSEGIDYDSASTDRATDINDSTNAWLPGYKITYCLDFTNIGNIVETEEGEDAGTIITTLPEPGCVPDTQTSTLRAITYTTSVDTYVGAQ